MITDLSNGAPTQEWVSGRSIQHGVDTQWRTLQGYEGTRAMHQLRKGHIQGKARGDIGSQISFMEQAIGLGA